LHSQEIGIGLGLQAFTSSKRLVSVKGVTDNLVKGVMNVGVGLFITVSGDSEGDILLRESLVREALVEVLVVVGEALVGEALIVVREALVEVLVVVGEALVAVREALIVIPHVMMMS